jgi:NitT/TauT family transport system permease protein
MTRAVINLARDAALDAEASKHVVLPRQLSPFQKLWRDAFVRKTVIILLLAVAWELYGRLLDNPLLFPTLSDTIRAFVDRIADGVLLDRAWTSIKVLLIGYALGITLAAIITILAISTQIGTDFLEVMTAMFNPLPAIALLPLALIWFGLGTTSIVFVLLHSVVWVVALNTQSGFLAVSHTLRMVGRNYELTGLRYVAKILIPAAFPSILTGLKIGWAFAWRTLIAAELVFGVASGQGGLGWFIFENRNLLDIPAVFAGLLTVIIIGLIVENFVFRLVEKKTVRRWGMQS